MAQYYFETPVDLIDETLRVLSPRELANYLYFHNKKYLKELQWEAETLELDNLFEGFDSYEDYANSHGQYSLPL